MSLLPRHVVPRIRDALADTPVVVIHGPRQSGKSTLVRDLLPAGGRYVTLDDLGMQAAATRDPEGFLAGLGRPVTIDEAQRAPGLVQAVKAAVDRDRTPGSFVLTGSADIFARSRTDESLAGRRETITLWPLTQAEISHAAPVDPQSWFDHGPPSHLPSADITAVIDRIMAGGFPEAVGRPSSRRDRWFASYLDEVVRFEVADRSAIEQLTEIPTLLRLLAEQRVGLLNATRLASDLQMSTATLRRYLTLLTEVYIVVLHPAWTVSTRTRLVKSPKVTIADSGLAAHLVGYDTSRPHPARRDDIGPLLETFVITELRRLIDALGLPIGLHHFRAHAGHEVDIVLQDRRGRVLGIEVKASTTVTARHFKGIEALAAIARDDFAGGMVLHPGREVIPHGDQQWAVPLSLLWTSTKT